MLRLEEIILQDVADNDLVEVHFMMADRNGNMSLAYRSERACDRNGRRMIPVEHRIILTCITDETEIERFRSGLAPAEFPA
jgi:hypothetical protein